MSPTDMSNASLVQTLVNFTMENFPPDIFDSYSSFMVGVSLSYQFIVVVGIPTNLFMLLLVTRSPAKPQPRNSLLKGILAANLLDLCLLLPVFLGLGGVRAVIDIMDEYCLTFRSVREVLKLPGFVCNWSITAMSAARLAQTSGRVTGRHTRTLNVLSRLIPWLLAIVVVACGFVGLHNSFPCIMFENPTAVKIYAIFVSCAPLSLSVILLSVSSFYSHRNVDHSCAQTGPADLVVGVQAADPVWRLAVVVLAATVCDGPVVVSGFGSKDLQLSENKEEFRIICLLMGHFRNLVLPAAMMTFDDIRQPIRSLVNNLITCRRFTLTNGQRIERIDTC